MRQLKVRVPEPLFEELSMALPSLGLTRTQFVELAIRLVLKHITAFSIEGTTLVPPSGEEGTTLVPPATFKWEGDGSPECEALLAELRDLSAQPTDSTEHMLLVATRKMAIQRELVANYGAVPAKKPSLSAASR